MLYTCQLSRLQVENFDLTPAHTCGPISHAWLKNVSCYRLAWHNFQKYVNSNPCKERKPCVKWINDNTFLAISDFVDFVFSITSPSADFGRLRKTSDFFGNLRKWSCRLQSQHSQDKNLTLITQKKLAGILHIPWLSGNVSFFPPLAWENSRHLATLPLVSPPNDVWETSAEIPYWWWCVTTQGSDVSCMKFLPLFLRRHLVAASRNVGCFLRLYFSLDKTRL